MQAPYAEPGSRLTIRSIRESGTQVATARRVPIFLVGSAGGSGLRVSPVDAFATPQDLRDWHGFHDCAEARSHGAGERRPAPRATAPLHARRARDPFPEREPVRDFMTNARALVSVAPGTPAAVADEAARRAGVRHLAVLDRGALAGVLCRCDLVGVAPERPVEEQMTGEVLAVRAGAPLGDAVAAMGALGIGFLPVLADPWLVGVITRGDLRRAGAPEERLGARRCAACGSSHGVRAHPRLADVEFCLECIERDATELGDGD